MSRTSRGNVLARRLWWKAAHLSRSSHSWRGCIYQLSMEEASCGAVFSGQEWLIPRIGADFPCFASKLVQI